MPSPSLPTAPFFAVLAYHSLFSSHKARFFFGSLVPTATADPSGLDYGYGASSGLGWYNTFSLLLVNIFKLSHSDVIFDTTTLYSNPSPGVTIPFPIYTAVNSSAGSNGGSTVESAAITLTFASALNHKAKITIEDCAYDPAQKLGLGSASGSPFNLIYTQVVTNNMITTRFASFLTRGLSTDIQFNRRWLRKRGQR